MRNNQKILIIFYNCINFALVAIFMKEATIIKGDGPGGFGEMIIKSAITLPTLALYFITLTLSLRSLRFNKFFIFFIIATLWFIFLATLAIWDACSDDKGYCRNWILYLR